MVNEFLKYGATERRGGRIKKRKSQIVLELLIINMRKGGKGNQR